MGGTRLHAILKNHRAGRGSYCELQTMAAAKEVSVDAAKVAVLSKLGIFIIKVEQKTSQHVSTL